MDQENEPSTENEPAMRVVSKDDVGTTTGASSDSQREADSDDTVVQEDQQEKDGKEDVERSEPEKIEVKSEQGSGDEEREEGKEKTKEAGEEDVSEDPVQDEQPNEESKQESKQDHDEETRPDVHEDSEKETEDVESSGATPKPAVRQRSLAQIKTLFPIDAKLLQYCYISRKLVSFIMIVKKTKESLADLNTPLVDPQSVLLLSGPIFNVNDNFYRRSELLQNMQKYNPAQTIDVSFVLSPISFDSLENISRNSPVNPYGIPLEKMVPLPERKKIIDTITLLELLLLSVYEVVDARFNAALSQVNRQHGTKETKQSIFQNLSVLKFPELSIVDQLTFTDIPNIPSTKQESILRFYLKTQFRFLEIKLATFQNIIDELKIDVHRTSSLVTRSKTTAQKPQQLSPLYTMYTLLLRISDMYIEIRKTGKTIYFQNVNYFSPYSRSRKSVREALAKMSIYFTHTKQNSMILTLIAKYARRTEIKNISLDSNIFVSEFRKISLEMLVLLDKMMAVLREIHNEWTFILTEGKDSEFSKETMREKLRERVNSDREKRLKALCENQKEMKTQMEHLRAGSVTPSDVSNSKSRLANRRISSLGSIGSIDENSSLNTNGTKATRRLSMSGTPSPGSASSSPSLTGSARSPFYRQGSAASNRTVSASTSRSNSLTSTSASRRLVSRRSSVGDLQGEHQSAKLADMSSVAESPVFAEPPRIGHTVQRKGSYGSLTSGSSSSSRTSSLTRQSTSRGLRSPSVTDQHGIAPESPTLTRRASVIGGTSSATRRSATNNSRCNSLTSSPTVKKGETLQRRSSVLLSHASAPSLRSQANGNAGNDNNNGSIKRRSSISRMPTAKNESKEAQMAKLAAKRVVPHNLTAQQRLQQHILKSAQNGSVYGKPLESRRTFVTKAASPIKADSHLGDNDMAVQSQMHMMEAQAGSLDEKLSETLEPPNINPDLQVTPASPSLPQGSVSSGSDRALSDFPGSPLNSLKASSLEAQNALKLQIINRSRSNSNTNTGTPVSRTTRTSPTKPSASPSPSRVRSRSNSALTKLTPVSRQTSLESSGSVSDLSRRSSVSSTAQARTRSRSSSVIGNIDVVSESETAGDFKVGPDGEILKKVRFAGVSQYSEDEDAPTPQHMQKQIRQKWAAYKPLFRKLNSQEGLVFKQNHMEDANGNNTNTNTNYGGGLITGPMNANGGGLGLNPNLVMGAQVQANGKIMLMDVVTNNAESEAARGMSNMSLRRERKGFLGNGNSSNGNGSTGNSGGGTATARLSRLFRKR